MAQYVVCTRFQTERNPIPQQVRRGPLAVVGVTNIRLTKLFRKETVNPGSPFRFVMLFR
jgi:hypothetical protein